MAVLSAVECSKRERVARVGVGLDSRVNMNWYHTQASHGWHQCTWRDARPRVDGGVPIQCLSWIVDLPY